MTEVSVLRGKNKKLNKNSTDHLLSGEQLGSTGIRSSFDIITDPYYNNRKETKASKTTKPRKSSKNKTPTNYT